jgi:hypothetical protein
MQKDESNDYVKGNMSHNTDMKKLSPVKYREQRKQKQ